MEYLNWMAEHWLLTLMLTSMLTGGFFRAVTVIGKSIVENRDKS